MKGRGLVAGIALAIFGLGAPALAHQGECPGIGGSGMMQGGHMAGSGPCQRLSQIATQQVENTPQGAVVTITAKNPNDVNEVQRLVQSCPRFGALNYQNQQQGFSPGQQVPNQPGQP